MGGAQAANVLAQITEERKRKAGIEMTEEEINKIKEPLLKQFENESSPYYSTARLWDDGIIDPTDTRWIIATCLKAASNSPQKDTKFGVFRM